MKPSTLLVPAIVVLVFSRSASAQQPSRLEALAGAGLGYRITTAIDLAEQAGEAGYGSADDTTGRGALAFELRGGVLFPAPIELDATGSIAVGGLSIDQVERRYLGTSADIVGSTLSAGLDGSARFAPAPSSDLRLLAGPAIGWTRMVTNSSAGTAGIDLLGVGVDLGARLRLNTISRVVDGQLELVLRARRELPVGIYVAHSKDDVLFTGADGGDPIYSFGFGLSYVFAFHRRDAIEPR